MNERKALVVDQNFVDEDACCYVCGEDLEDGDPTVNMPCPEISERAEAMVCPGCAANEGYSVTWPEGLWEVIVAMRQGARADSGV